MIVNYDQFLKRLNEVGFRARETVEEFKERISDPDSEAFELNEKTEGMNPYLIIFGDRLIPGYMSTKDAMKPVAVDHKGQKVPLYALPLKDFVATHGH